LSFKRGYVLSDKIKAGWYQDPTDPSIARFWDGNSWTQDVNHIESVASKRGNRKSTKNPTDTPSEDKRKKPLKLENTETTGGMQKKEDSNSVISASKEEKIASKKLEKEEKARKKRELEAEFNSSYGRVVAQGMFDLTTIKIYQKGYVSFSSIFGSQPEKLISCEVRVDVLKKSGIGRSVATVATLATPFPGFNMLSPSNRGDVYLIFTTDSRVKTFHTNVPMTSTIKISKSLEAAANAVINANKEKQEERKEIVIQSSKEDLDISAQLEKLNQLYKSGALTEDEFKAAKSRLLGTT